MVHHLIPSTIANRASASMNRMRAVLTPIPAKSRFPIPLALPCEIMLAIFEMLPPESAVSLVCCCWYMNGLYCEEGTFPADELWAQLLRRTFPLRLTGAPGPNAPPRLRRSNHLTVSQLSCDWCEYARQLRAVSHLPRQLLLFPAELAPPFRRRLITGHLLPAAPAAAAAATTDPPLTTTRALVPSPGASPHRRSDRQVCPLGRLCTQLVQAHPTARRGRLLLCARPDRRHEAHARGVY